LRVERILFAGTSGQLAARLDAPDHAPSAYALFAHSFTCGKDVLAAARIAQQMSALGVAVLRFDFTGLGASEGEFANTSFSSNVADLVAAAAHLRSAYAAPALLIGHSLGGAAALAAAGSVPECKAVVTIAAPSVVRHVTHLFADQLANIDAAGEADVVLGGRPFKIKRQFLLDAEEQNLMAKIGELRRALLVMHSPRDTTVDISNATRIFMAAKHPKSFVSLDTADHLLTVREDAVYAANLIAAWAVRFLPN
jgi:putative redox protein